MGEVFVGIEVGRESAVDRLPTGRIALPLGSALLGSEAMVFGPDACGCLSLNMSVNRVAWGCL